VSSGLIGISAIFAITGEANGQPQRVFYTRDELTANLRGVRSLAGAIDLLEMRGLVPRIYPYEAGNQTVWMKPQCTARQVVEDAEGWTVTGVHLQINCDRELVRDFRVTRTGHAGITGERQVSASIQCWD
jgi:hypothetical protein